MNLPKNPWQDFSTPQTLEEGSATLTYKEMGEEASEPEEPEDEEEPAEQELLTKALATIQQQSELISNLMAKLTTPN